MKEKLNINQIPELKQAILDLSEKERNQMLIRLINKDQVLIEQLHFKLLEDEYDLIKRFEDLKNEIESDLSSHLKSINSSNLYVRGKLLLRLIRGLSGKINHFAKVTKNTHYELLLRTYLVTQAVFYYKHVVAEDTIFGHKIRVYIVARIKAMIKLFDKLHDELKYDFSAEYFEEIESVAQQYILTELHLEKVDFQKLKFH